LVGVEGWTVVFGGDRLEAEIVASALQAQGLRAEVLGSRVFVPDDVAKIARRFVEDAEQESEPDAPPGRYMPD
jgi:hypothetical protein